MNLAEAHALAVAVEERRAELARYRDWYATNTVGREWVDLARENAIRLDELDRLLLFANVAEMSEPAHKCPADYLGAPGCVCVVEAVR